MEGSIQLNAAQRNALLKAYRYGADAPTSRRAHVVLLLAEGMSYRQLQTLLFASNDLINACLTRFRAGGVAAVLGTENPDAQSLPGWLVSITRWLLTKTPREFGYFRTRWSCAALAEVLWWEKAIHRSPETIRRGLRKLGFAWRRPRPVVGPTDPHYCRKLRRIQGLLKHLPPDETAVFQDEVDVNLNPKIGSTWMLRGQQQQVVTPGNNDKRYLAGSLVWRTGTLLLSSPARRRNTELFLDHLDELRRRLRGYRVIHVICDNAGFHRSRAVQDYLQQQSHRIRLHFLPVYAPETNPIERVWWHLHETITRNHCCQTIDELVEEVYEWFAANSNYSDEIPTRYQVAA